MTTYLDFPLPEITTKGGIHTAREIAGQPQLWQAVYDQILAGREALADFLSPVLRTGGLRIILTGAGSSAFIGETARGILQKETGKLTAAIATTDLVTHPELFFLREAPTLLISFARSGNSPESLEAVKLADRYCKQAFHLIITCSGEGLLARQPSGPKTFVLVLPEHSNDKALAMTGSFTSMLLAVTLAAKLGRIESLRPHLEGIMLRAQELSGACLPLIREAALADCDRIIFLGSGPLLGIARECHLKVQELTDGEVICKYDSFLGFRHGPRAVATGRSMIVYLFSEDEHVLRYEKDLADSIYNSSPEIPTVSLGGEIPGIHTTFNLPFERTSREKNELYFIPPVIFGQLLGFFRSLGLGLRPDTPSRSGAISRVVEGVTIYPEE